MATSTAIPKEAIRELFASLSGAPKSRVYWSGEPEGPVGPIGGKAGKITINVVASVQEGLAEVRRTFSPDTETWFAVRTITLSVRADNFLRMGEAYDTLETLRFLLEMPPARAYLRAAGLTLVDAMSISTLDYAVDTRAISSASLDVRLSHVVEYDVPQGQAATWIEKVTHKKASQVPDVAAAPVVDLAFTRLDTMPRAAFGHSSCSIHWNAIRRVSCASSGHSGASASAVVA